MFVCVQLDVFFILQDTLIVWSEADNYDLALSFQEKAGCDEVWEKICQVNSVLVQSVLCIVLKNLFNEEYKRVIRVCRRLNWTDSTTNVVVVNLIFTYFTYYLIPRFKVKTLPWTLLRTPSMSQKRSVLRRFQRRVTWWSFLHAS